jgi:hypothetical protein
MAAGVAAAVSSGIHGGVAMVDRERLTQQGSVTVPANSQQEVYYPVPYASPPNVQLSGPGVSQGSIQLKEQKADHFTAQCTSAHFTFEVHWRAEGVRRR